MQSTLLVSRNHSTSLISLFCFHCFLQSRPQLRKLKDSSHYKWLRRFSQTTASKQGEELHSSEIEDSVCDCSITLEALSTCLGKCQRNQSDTNVLHKNNKRSQGGITKFIKIYYIIFRWLWVKNHQTYRGCPSLKPHSSSFSLKFLPFLLLKLEICFTYFKS